MLDACAIKLGAKYTSQSTFPTERLFVDKLDSQGRDYRLLTNPKQYVPL